MKSSMTIISNKEIIVVERFHLTSKNQLYTDEKGR